MAKIQPAVLNLKFEIAANQTKFIDISQAASIVNRRFYRQGLNWVVGGFTVMTAAGKAGEITIAKLPQTWVCSNAWHKAYAHQKSQQDDALEEAGGMSARARYRDFKIHMNEAHVIATFSNNELPKDMANNDYLPGEWLASKIVVPNIVPDASGSTVDPDEFLLHMVGPNATAAGTSRGIISGYANSRAFPQSPDPVSPFIHNDDNWFQQMDDVGNDNLEIIQNATDRNDDLPYNQIEYPGADSNGPTLEVVHETSLVASSWNTTSRQLSGTNVPCGLLQVFNGIPDGILNVFVQLVPGQDRGYMTQKMQDM